MKEGYGFGKSDGYGLGKEGWDGFINNEGWDWKQSNDEGWDWKQSNDEGCNI